MINRRAEVLKEIEEKKRRALRRMARGGFARYDASAIDDFISLSGKDHWFMEFEVDFGGVLLPEESSWEITEAYVQQAVGPLRAGLGSHKRRGRPIAVEVGGKTYRLTESLPYHVKTAWPGAPLASHACPDLVRAVLLLGSQLVEDLRFPRFG